MNEPSKKCCFLGTIDQNGSLGSLIYNRDTYALDFFLTALLRGYFISSRRWLFVAQKSEPSEPFRAQLAIQYDQNSRSSTVPGVSRGVPAGAPPGWQGALSTARSRPFSAATNGLWLVQL
jgi:hypothetical protein